MKEIQDIIYNIKNKIESNPKSQELVIIFEQTKKYLNSHEINFFYSEINYIKSIKKNIFHLIPKLNLKENNFNIYINGLAQEIEFLFQYLFFGENKNFKNYYNDIYEIYSELLEKIQDFYIHNSKNKDTTLIQLLFRLFFIFLTLYCNNDQIQDIYNKEISKKIENIFFNNIYLDNFSFLCSEMDKFKLIDSKFIQKFIKNISFIFLIIKNTFEEKINEIQISFKQNYFEKLLKNPFGKIKYDKSNIKFDSLNSEKLNIENILITNYSSILFKKIDLNWEFKNNE